MKNIRIMLATGAIMVFSGCASTAPSSTDCSTAVARKVTINYKKNTEIKVNPPRRDVEQGQAIQFIFKGDAGIAVTVDGEDVEDEWIDTDGKGSPGGNSFFVCVDDEQDPDDYKYNIIVDGVGTLDPVVRVKTKGRGT